MTRVEMAELEDLLRTPEAMEYYLDAVEIEAGLFEFSAKGAFEEETIPESTTVPSDIVVAMPSRGHRLLYASAAALLFLGVVGTLLVINRSGQDRGEQLVETPPAIPIPNTEVAEIVRHIGVPLPQQTAFRTNDILTLTEHGLVEIQCAGGARVLLEGPAEVAFEDADTVVLRDGHCHVVVPASDNRFSLHTDRGTTWSLGGEFAASLAGSQGALEVGVFAGRAYLEDELHVHEPHLIYEDDAVRVASGEAPISIAFPFQFTHREFPERELAWKAPSESFNPVTIEHDLNGLIWGPGHYRVYFKWMHGTDALQIHAAEILLNGQTVASDVHLGVAGDPLHSEDHAYHFEISGDDYCTGNWSLRTVVQTNPRNTDQIQLPDEILNPYGVVLLAGDPRLTTAREELVPKLSRSPNSHGVLLVEQGHSAEPYEFCHEWEYVHNGQTYRRTFFENGTARLERDGEILTSFDRATWSVDDGILTLSICHPDTDAFICVERHLLRDDGTLLFLDRPYPHAKRVQ